MNPLTLTPSADRRPGAKNDDHSRVAAPVSKDPATPPSSGVVPLLILCMRRECRAVQEADGSWRTPANWELETIEHARSEGTVRISDAICPQCQAQHEAQQEQLSVLGSMARNHRLMADRLRAIGQYGLAEMEEAEAAKITQHATTLV